MEQALIPSERTEGVPTPISVQTKVGGGEGAFQKTTVEATRKLVETAYQLGKSPTMLASYLDNI